MCNEEEFCPECPLQQLQQFLGFCILHLTSVKKYKSKNSVLPSICFLKLTKKTGDSD